jgi:membrane associated rhomboid family serine protease
MVVRASFPQTADAMRDFFAEINRMLDRFLTPAVKVILVINVVSLLFFTILMAVNEHWWELLMFLLGQTPSVSVLHLFVWQFLTYNFVHANFVHLFMNMLALWFFAPPLENRWGTRRFWQFYLITGVGAGVCHALLTLLTGNANQTIVGASGAIYGVLLGFAAYHPDQPVYLMGVVPIKAKYLVILMILMIFLSSAGYSGGNVSHLTHLTGLIVAYVWMAIYHRDWDIRRWRWTRGR